MIQFVTVYVTEFPAQVVIKIKTRKLAKKLGSKDAMLKAYGKRMARAIQTRVELLTAASSLADVPIRPPIRLHQLKGKLSNHFAVDLVHPQRLILFPRQRPVPRLDDGGIDKEGVTEVTIVDIVDYH